MLREEPAMGKEAVMDLVALAGAFGFTVAEEQVAAVGTVLFVVVSLALQFKAVRAKVAPLVKQIGGDQE